MSWVVSIVKLLISKWQVDWIVFCKNSDISVAYLLSLMLGKSRIIEMLLLHA
ncbi:MAG: hypothetical protein K0R98_95 [Rickettsiaceae bacterium]|jgi:hypothetical protein|nr:hypothetical protein [Rickettsiaceae bacterium]